MILAAVNSRVGTLIPSDSMTVSAHNATNDYTIMDTIDLDYKESSLGSTVPSMVSTIRSASSQNYLSDDNLKRMERKTKQVIAIILN